MPEINVPQTMLAEEFERQRPRLESVAHRVLGDRASAQDAVQEAWMRLSRSEPAEIDNLAGWLTTVVSRVCLDQLRARRSRREDALTAAPEVAGPDDGPEQHAEQADAVGTALLVVLDALAPAERLAFVLHDLFAMSFDEIAPIVDRTPAAARQLASRARRRVQGAPTSTDRARQRKVVAAFLDASRHGRFAELMTLLDPEVVLRADPAAIEVARANSRGQYELAPELRGNDAVAAAISGHARGARLALVDGSVGATWAPGNKPRGAFVFTIRDDTIIAIEVYVDPQTVTELDVSLL